MKTALMVIAPSHFRDEEYAAPKQILEDHAVSVSTASIDPGECIGKLGMHAIATISVADAARIPFDAVVFVGGAGAAVFFDNPKAHALARQQADAGRVLAAICVAPSILAHAHLLDGVRATAFPSREDDLRAFGAIWTGAPVTRDGQIITANGPDSAREFGAAIVAALTT